MILYEAKHKDELACLMIAYYDLILVDGKATGEEDKAFHKLCNEMKVDESLESTVKQYCVRTVGNEKKNRVQRVQENMEIVLQKAKPFSIIRHFGDRRSQVQYPDRLNIGNKVIIYRFPSLFLPHEKLTFLWNLFRVGYADGALDTEETEVLRFVAGYLEIEDFYYAEYSDAASTIVDLNALKKKLHQMDLPKDEVHTRVSKINKQIKQIEEDEEITADQYIM